MHKRKNRSPKFKIPLRILIIICIGLFLVNCKAPSTLDKPMIKPVIAVGKGEGKVKKTKDRNPPSAAMTLPNDGATNVAINTNIVILLQDTGSGVDLRTVVMTVDGNVVYDGTNPTLYSQTTNYADTSASGNPSKYTLTCDPKKDYGYLQPVNVTVKASDISGNVMALNSYSFMTEPQSGSVITCQAGDNDCDGISDVTETNIYHTSPNKKTLFVRPKKETGGYWTEFIQLFTDVRPGFADISPFTNAEIEISIIGAPNNPYGPMTNINYDPADPVQNPKHLPCDILEIVYRDGVNPVTGIPSYCGAGNNNYGHTYFSSITRTWYWDTKGYTPNNTANESPKTKYGYFGVDIYPFTVDHYIKEGAYPSIQIGQTPVTTTCPWKQCYDTSLSSPLNLNRNDPVYGRPDDTVEFNTITFDYLKKITFVDNNSDKDEFYRPDILRRVIAHEMGHAILAASQFDHCADSQCILYGNSVDWKMHDFGPSSCVHSPGGSKDIRANGIIHNSIH